MKTITGWSFILFGLAPFVPVAAMALSTADCRAHYDRLLEIQGALETDNSIIGERLTAAQLEFQQRLGASEAVGTDCRLLQFRSLYVVDFYVRDETTLNGLRDALSAIEALGVADTTHRADFFRALMGHRRFDEAHAFRSSHPGLEVEEVPEIAAHDVIQPAAYRIAGASDNQLIPLAQDLDGIRLVAVVHPLCGYSKRALTALTSDQADVAPDRTVYLAPVGERLFVDELRDWNAANDAAEIVLANRQEDWPFIDNWTTPSFYILKDGQVTATLTGWPDDSQLDRLRQMVDAAD